MNEKLRQRILYESARLLHSRRETDSHRARIRAARAVARGWIHPGDLPNAREISEAIRQIEVGIPPAEYTNVGRDLQTDDDARFEAYEKLLRPLAFVSQHRRRHPEGDVLYHSLQVFELVCDDAPYDEDLLLAGLLHDVGKQVDPLNHVEPSLRALSGLISNRTAWLIEQHVLARGLTDGSIGVRARRRLSAHEDFESLELLVHADLDGRQPGMQVREVEDALAYIRNLSSHFDEWQSEEDT